MRICEECEKYRRPMNAVGKGIKIPDMHAKCTRPGGFCEAGQVMSDIGMTGHEQTAKGTDVSDMDEMESAEGYEGPKARNFATPPEMKEPEVLDDDEPGPEFGREVDRAADRAMEAAERERLAKLEGIIAKGLRDFVDVGMALMEIREGRLYRGDFPTFEEYCQEKWDLGKAYGHRLISSSQVVRQIEMSPIGDTFGKPNNEAQARSLTLLKIEEDRIQAWEAAARNALELGKPVTAQMVKDEVVRIKRRNGEEEDGPKRVPAVDDPTIVGKRWQAAEQALLTAVQLEKNDDWHDTSRGAVIATLKSMINYAKRESR